MALRLLLMVSASGDWTQNTPREEFPVVQSIYRLTAGRIWWNPPKNISIGRGNRTSRVPMANLQWTKP